MDTIQTTYENIHVLIDEQELTSLVISPDGLHWKMKMVPRQEALVSVSYDARGMEAFTYLVPESREIKDFILTITSNESNVFASINPVGDTIEYYTNIMPDGSFISTATIDRAVVAPAMIVSFIQKTNPYAPQDLSLHLLRFMPRASIFLVAIFVFTILIAGLPVNLRTLTTFQAVSWTHILIFLFISPLITNPRMGLLLDAVFITVSMSFVLRGFPRWPLIMILAWTFFFTGIYPFSGQKVETFPNNPYDNLVILTMLIYIFSYSLFRRMETPHVKKEMNKQERRIRRVHWAARIFSIPVILLYGSLFILIVTSVPPSNMQWEKYLFIILIAILTFSSILAWKFEMPGGSALLIDGIIVILFAALMGFPLTELNFWGLFLLIVIGPIFLAGSLFLYSWKLKKAQSLNAEKE
ncbi:MAG: hypothetical protein MUO77_18290 [Anaerolineales bacterium]|nr:hypothetical protein [Anaerolineales bacterium]